METETINGLPLDQWLALQNAAALNYGRINLLKGLAIGSVIGGVVVILVHEFLIKEK